MNPMLRQACEQADNCISGALGGRRPVKSRPSDRGTIASPAPRALGLDGETLAAAVRLEDSWFEAVSAEGGFLNLTLRAEWYAAALAAVEEAEPFAPYPPVSVDFPAAIDGEDWAIHRFLWKKQPDPARCARQDAENPGWLLRYTVERLAAVQSPEPLGWTAEERRLMWLMACCPEGSPRKLAYHLTQVVEAVWQITPQRIPAPLSRGCRAVLNRGRAELRKAAD